MEKKYYWEDFPVGHVVEHGPVTLTKEDILRFGREFDPQPFHTDEEAAKRHQFGGLIASGWHICSLCMRMMCEAYLLDSNNLASPGVDRIRWLKPVRPGDSLTARGTVLEARPLKSKPGVGIALSHWEMINQHGEVVMEMQGWGMMRRRNAGA
ncbi:MAG TPA: MaoC family dehydratase [Candidatus Desulfobacillus sp.]|nr:MaoC family dehydratase [Candidatus Desulfobacillus sp.]